MKIFVSPRAKAVGTFAGVATIILIVSLASIFVGGYKPQIVAPIAALAFAVSVFVFLSQFNVPQNDRPVSMATNSPLPAQKQSNLGITVVKVLIVVALVIGAANVLTFAMEAWRGTLDSYELRRFIPKAAFGIVLIGYALRKIRTKTPF